MNAKILTEVWGPVTLQRRHLMTFVGIALCSTAELSMPELTWLLKLFAICVMQSVHLLHLPILQGTSGIASHHEEQRIVSIPLHTASTYH